MEIDPVDMYSMVLYQVGALKAILDSEGVPLNHVKPHGELYFYMQRDEPIMLAVLTAIKTFDVPVYACLSSHQAAMCNKAGVSYMPEFYPDVDYDGKGALVPVAKSKVPTAADIEARVTKCIVNDTVVSDDGSNVLLGFGKSTFSICIHSDRPAALTNAQVARTIVDKYRNQI